MSSLINRIVENTFYGLFPIPESVRLNVTTLPRGWRLMIVWSWTVMLQKSNYTPWWFTQRSLHISFPSLCKVLQFIRRNVGMSHFRHSWENKFGWGVLCWWLQRLGLPNPLIIKRWMACCATHCKVLRSLVVLVVVVGALLCLGDFFNPSLGAAE